MQTRQVTTPKSFFVSERDKFYSAWVDAFPREFVQNSVDAGAKNLVIDIARAPAKSSFGKDPGMDWVTRVTFSDDGNGMSRQVLDGVFFALGESTKRDAEGSVGGFGRARIMQAFSQVRYSIRTRDNFVEGDGPTYVVSDVAEAAAAAERLGEMASEAAREAAASGKPASAERLAKAAELHRSDAASVSGPVKGCVFEVDLDPNGGDSDRRRPSVERMTKAFKDYFAQSDIKCRVVLNGEEVSPPARRMEKRKQLAATMDAGDVPATAKSGKIQVLDRSDGRKDVVFGTLYSIKPKDVGDGERGYLNVRVNGASMYKSSSNSSDHALVLELTPALAREVLTSNRDGMRAPYRDAVDEFTKMMATDAHKALESREGEEFLLLQGGQGHRMRSRPATDYSSEVETPAAAPERLKVLEEQARTSSRTVRYGSWDWDDMVSSGLGGVDFKEISSFLQSLKGKDVSDTLLSGFADRAHAMSFRETLERQGEHTALMLASGTLLGFICDQLKFRVALAEHRKADGYRDKLSSLHDTPILKRDLAPPESRYGEDDRKSRKTAMARAIRRYDPRNWDVETGKGRAPHRLLTAWTVAVDNAVDLLLKTLPKLQNFPYSTGWTFSHKQWDYVSSLGEWGWRNAAAKYLRPNKEDAMCHFLLNPLDDEDFTMRFNPDDPEDRAKLWAYAVHEVAHRVSTDHNEAFASIMTDMFQRATPAFLKAMDKETVESMKAVSRLYGKGRTKAQPMDDEPGPRPTERLLSALAAAPEPDVSPEGVLTFDEPSRSYDDELDQRPGMRA